MSSKLVGQELKCLVVSLMKSSTTLNEDVKRNTKKTGENCRRDSNLLLHHV